MFKVSPTIGVTYASERFLLRVGISAIFPLDDLPDKRSDFPKKNAEYFGR